MYISNPKKFGKTAQPQNGRTVLIGQWSVAHRLQSATLHIRKPRNISIMIFFQTYFE